MKNTRAILDLLPIFSTLTDRMVLRLIGGITVASVPSATEILRESDPADAAYFIISGFVKVVRGSDDRRYAIAVLGPQDIFGELGAITGEGRSASIVALTECTVARIEKSLFLECIGTESSVSGYMLRYLARRVTEADRQIELFRGEIEPRLKFWLNHFSERGLDVRKALSNAEIARMMGTRREVVSRLMSKLARVS